MEICNRLGSWEWKVMEKWFFGGSRWEFVFGTNLVESVEMSGIATGVLRLSFYDERTNPNLLVRKDVMQI
jgi:hypothetical protein